MKAPLDDSPTPAADRSATGESSVNAADFRPLAPQGDRGEGAGIELLADVTVQVSVELGSTRMTIREVLALQTGSVIELDRLAGEPSDILLNGTRFGRGEIVVVDEKFGVRIMEIAGRNKH